MFRHSCGVCHFTNTCRPSDMTMADFWGWENIVPDMNSDNNGVSLVLLNSVKGKDLFEKANSRLDIIEVDIKDCLQKNLCVPTPAHPYRNEFEQLYKKKGFVLAMRKYVKYPNDDVFYSFVRSCVKKLANSIRNFYEIRNK